MTLALDPSFSATGWVVIKGKVIVCSGVIQCKSKLKGVEADQERAAFLAEEISELIRSYKITDIVTEAPVGAKSAAAIKVLAICQGIVFGVAKMHDIPVTCFKPQDVKKAFTGKANSDKATMVVRAIEEFGFDFSDTPKYAMEAISDAAAVWYTSSKS